MPNGQGPGSNNSGGNGKYKGTKNNDLIVGDGSGQTLEGLEGDDTLIGLGGDDTLIGGAGADLLDGGEGADDIYADSLDTVDYSSASGPMHIWLESTFPSLFTGGASDGDRFVAVDNVIGSAFGDLITGNDRANRLDAGDGDDSLEGRSGNDILIGGLGNDTLNGGFGADNLEGGDGIDTASWEDALVGVTVDLAAGTSSQGDTLSGIENLEGSALADDLAGDGGANAINAGAGDDTIRWTGGNDTMTGGEGADTFYFPDPDSIVPTEFITITISDFDGEAGDRLFFDTSDGSTPAYLIPPIFGDDLVINFITFSVVLEGIADPEFGSNFDPSWITSPGYDDIVTSDPGVSETIHTGTGNDLIKVILPSESTLDGGDDIDTLDFSGAPIGMNVLLDGFLTINYGTPLPRAPIFTGGGAEYSPTSALALDEVVNIENLIGTDYADVLAGTADDNVISGGSGSDDIIGNGGSDTVTGGAGSDFFVVSGTVAGDLTVLDFTWAEGDRLVFSSEGFDPAELTATDVDGNAVITHALGSVILIGASSAEVMETVAFYETGVRVPPAPDFTEPVVTVGTEDGEVLTGSDDRQDVISGLGGDDTIEGLGKADTLDGGLGNDSILGGAGSDELTGGEGADTLDGGDGWDILYSDGLDVLIGGDGIDTADFSAAGAGVGIVLRMPGPPDFSSTGTRHDLPDQYDSDIENLVGSAFDDTLSGSRLPNEISGGDGNDSIRGGDGNDWLVGGDGNDTLDGGSGSDNLDGGAGADVFRFRGGEQYDIISDFEIGIDLIDFGAVSSGFDPLDGALEFDDGVIIQGSLGTFVFLKNVALDQLSAEDFVFQSVPDFTGG